MMMIKGCVMAAAAAVIMTAGAVEVDGVAAQVGSTTILKSEVVAEMMRMGNAAASFDETLEHMIDVKLILKSAKDSKMTMQEWVVENRLKEIIDRSFGGDRNKLMAVLARDRVSYAEWRERMKNDMVVGAMRYQMIDKNVNATPSLMRREYAEHASRYASSHKVTVSVILLPPNSESKRKTIDEVLAADPKAFGRLARNHSSDSHASDDGIWKDVDPEEVFQPQICAAIAAIKVGETSKWIDIGGWNFLVRKDGEKLGAPRSFADAYEQIAANVREQEAKRLYQNWIRRLRDATYIKVY